MSGLRIEPLGEDALLLTLGDRVDAALNARVHALAAGIEAARPPWLREVVPAYASLALFVDDARADDPRADPLLAARDWLQAWLARDHASSGVDRSAATLDIPVCHGAGFAPDLDAVAAHARITPEEVVARHCAATYTVAMIGFAPGFPYLLGLDPALETPRLATPRTRVPAGSVAIGGAQTGIYPRESPGGWQVIGRTPLALFDAMREPACLLVPGQRVRFVPIDEAAFESLSQASRA